MPGKEEEFGNMIIPGALGFPAFRLRLVYITSGALRYRANLEHNRVEGIDRRIVRNSEHGAVSIRMP